MIVVPARRGLLLVRQPDHAAMSAQAARAWRRPERFPAPLWPRFIEAVRRHDDGWIEEEARPALDPAGRPYDFKSLPVPLHLEVWRRGVERVRPEDPYLSLLSAQHARWLFQAFMDRPSPEEKAAEEVASDEGMPEKLPEKMPEKLPQFLEEMDQAMEVDRKALEAGGPDERALMTPELLSIARRLLSFLDGLSLRLLGAIAMERTGALPFGERESPLVVREGKAGFEIRPWPFREPRVLLEARAVRLEEERFGSPEELATRMDSAGEERLRFELLA